MINTEELEVLREKFRDYIPKSLRSQECHDDIDIMVYPVVFNVDMGQQYQIKTVVEEIKTDSYYLENKSKPELPVIYFSVRGFVGRKVLQNVTEHTGLVVIDIDKQDNPDTDFTELKNSFCQDRHVLACFRSPSGGIKAVFNTDIRDKQHHKVYFHAISKYVLDNYPAIVKIDKSGSNINRACYMPYDADVYFNPYCFKYCLDDQQITELSQEIKAKKIYNNRLKPILEVDDYSFDDHYNSILNLLLNQTSVGIGVNPDNFLTDTNSEEKRTSVGLYDSVFNKYRYNNIKDNIMCTDVPFFETALWRYSYPYILDNETFLDENYFGDNTQEPICIENTKGFDDTDGIYFCEVRIPKDGIKIGYRHKTLASMSMKFIFNNPFCHPKRLVEHMQYINQKHCLDPQPEINPRPSDEEVKNIVMLNYQKFLCGELDFNKVLEKDDKTKRLKKKFVFHSRNYVDICSSYTKHRAHRCFTKGRLDKNVRKYSEATKTLMNGTRITYKGIAKQMGISERHLRRIRDDKEYRDFFEIQNRLMKDYNSSLKKNGVDEGVLDLGQDILENHKNLLKPDREKTKDKQKSLSDEEITRIYHRIYSDSNHYRTLNSEQISKLKTRFHKEIMSFNTMEKRVIMNDLEQVGQEDFFTHGILEGKLFDLLNEISHEEKNHNSTK